MSLAQVFSAQPAEILRQKLVEIRQTTLRITESLSPEDQMLQSMPDASPTKWHLAHTTWFYETFILQQYAPTYKPFDSRYRFLFNSYYKQVGAHPLRGSRGLMSRPSIEEVLAYRRYVDESVLAMLEVATPEVLQLVELGINHEQQHQELILTDIKHALWCSPLGTQEERAVGEDRKAVPPLNWIGHAGGIFEIGHGGSGFSFDNEGPRHEVLLRPFRIASRLVTNGEYLQFLCDRGYERPELWLSDAWDVVSSQQWRHPLYWENRDGSWWQFMEGAMEELRPDDPVCHISFYEADAFARWRGVRLPTEEEWEIVAADHPERGTLLEDGPVRPRAARGEGLQQMLGDAWEWTSSPYIAYPRFRPQAGALGEYNGKFMCNQLVLRGGSCATPASHIRTSYRNFFPPHARWQFSGVRLADDRS